VTEANGGDVLTRDKNRPVTLNASKCTVSALGGAGGGALPNGKATVRRVIDWEPGLRDIYALGKSLGNA
jgi:hypothetical protein